jgi:phosphoserine phosphatase RsbU/P
MTMNPSGSASADLISILRASPILGTLENDALGKIAELVASETREQVVAALREVDLFDGIGDEDLRRVQDVSVPVTLDADTSLFGEGDAGDRCYVVVRGAIELTGGAEEDEARREVLRSGEVFGSTALLSDAPRNVTARSVEPSYLVAIPRDGFCDVMGIDPLALRIFRNFSDAPRVTSACSFAGSSARPRETERAGGEALNEFNRMVRSRLLPQGRPNVPGYEVSATTLADDLSEGAAAWDWFSLTEGRVAVVVLKADQPSPSSAHQLLAVRGLLRDFARDPIGGPGALLSRVNRGMRAAWVDGVSSSVSCGLLVVSGDSVSWVSAGGIAGAIVRSDGRRGDDFVPEAVSLGLFDDVRYQSMKIRLGMGDHLLVFSDGPADAVIEGRKFLSAGLRIHDPAARLDALVRQVKDAGATSDHNFDVTAAILTRRKAPEDRPGVWSGAESR